MHSKLARLAAIAIISLPPLCGAVNPTPEEIRQWWGVQSKSIDDPLTIEENSSAIEEVQLTNLERAYLVPVQFWHRGRNDIQHTLLVRPAKRELCELDGTIQGRPEVRDLNNDGISEVITEGIGSGQGSTVVVKQIVHISPECSIQVLRRVVEEGNEGEWGIKSSRYYAKEVTWEFLDLDRNGVLDLREVRTTKEGRNGRSPRITSGTYNYLFEKNQFVRKAKIHKQR